MPFNYFDSLHLTQELKRIEMTRLYKNKCRVDTVRWQSRYYCKVITDGNMHQRVSFSKQFPEKLERGYALLMV